MNDRPYIPEECGKPYDHAHHQPIASVVLKYTLPPLPQLVSVTVAIDAAYGYDTVIDPTKTKVTTLYDSFAPATDPSAFHYAVHILNALESVPPKERAVRLALGTKEFVNRLLHVPVQNIDVQTMY